EDVADILRSLVAGEETAGEAVGELFGNIWHQGSIYEATAHAVPFLIEIFDSPSPARKEVGFLLRGIADGTSYHAVHRHRDRESEAERITHDSHEAEERTWVGNSHAAVNSGLGTYLRMLGDRTLDEQVRAVAASACGGCRERRGRALAGLLDVAASEPAGDVRRSDGDHERLHRRSPTSPAVLRRAAGLARPRARTGLVASCDAVGPTKWGCVSSHPDGSRRCSRAFLPYGGPALPRSDLSDDR
ncbi:MAG: hypothetical protein QOD63_3006, partial [Actinomycetota bacterium]|nr:hypothetical protein [Actinomycetota bacterium]